MKVVKQSLIDWMVEENGKVVARITKENGVYSVYTRDPFTNKMEIFFRYVSFKEAKQAALANA